MYVCLWCVVCHGRTLTTRRRAHPRRWPSTPSTIGPGSRTGREGQRAKGGGRREGGVAAGVAWAEHRTPMQRQQQTTPTAAIRSLPNTHTTLQPVALETPSLSVSLSSASSRPFDLFLAPLLRHPPLPEKPSRASSKAIQSPRSPVPPTVSCRRIRDCLLSWPVRTGLQAFSSGSLCTICIMCILCRWQGDRADS